MKRILLSMGILSVVGVGAYLGATGAFFSDTETSTGNTFTAGSIDLSIGSQFSSNDDANGSGSVPLTADNNGNILYTFTDIKPGDFGAGSFQLQVNSNPAYACAQSTIQSTPDNGINEPEGDAGDVTDGVNAGELQNFLQFATFADLNGNGVRDGGEPLNVNQFGGDGNGFTAAEITAAGWIPVADPSAPSTWLTVGSLAPATNYHAGFLYCFGNFDANGACNMYPMSTNTNVAQTDGISGSIEFMAVQTRNNENFLCSELNNVVVTETDLVESFAELAGNPNAWLFYNDTNDTIMTINQFSSTGGVNEIVAGPGGFGAAQMTLDNGTQSPDYDGANDPGNPRYNIATYKYKDVKLADIGSLKYRIYDDSVSSQTPYLHFNVDLLNNDTWQGRLVQIPSGVVADTWTTVDALAGTWTKTSGNWPAPINEPGSNPKTWAQIVAAYPNAETRSTDSFFGVRVGHPGPIGETSFVDWIEFDGETTDFEN